MTRTAGERRYPDVRSQTPPAPAGRERRTQTREPVDSSAQILLVKSGSRLKGRIADLSLGGCCIRLLERFPVGIYTRAEVEFSLEGLSFRLAGVIQSIHDQSTVGIRFLDVSERKRQQITELMAEIQEMRRAGLDAAADPIADAS